MKHNPRMLSPHFSLHEATYLRNWKVYHKPTPLEIQALTRTAWKLEGIRHHLIVTLCGNVDTKIIITSWLRPNVVRCDGTYNGRDYNECVGGCSKSRHMYGDGVDWILSGFSSIHHCRKVRESITPLLNALDMRMKIAHKTNFIHTDSADMLPYRLFR